jgi:hypothetical protein
MVVKARVEQRLENRHSKFPSSDQKFGYRITQMHMTALLGKVIKVNYPFLKLQALENFA